MVCQNSQEMEDLVRKAKEVTGEGVVASYIPALQKADQHALSVATYESGGRCLSAGDTEKKFTLQSVTKLVTLALAIMDRGEAYVFDRVGMEPTGDPFNSIAKLESIRPNKPLNPMINAGALAVTHMIKGRSHEEKLARIVKLIQQMSNNPTIYYSREVAKSEFESAFLNRSLCYFLKEHRVISGNIEELMDIYTKQCAIEVNCLDLARIGTVLACDGKDPDTNEEVIPAYIARLCKTFMVTCGMYNASGEFAIKIGIPAKSGVSGAILGLVPGRFGIGLCGPALDTKGNSIAGVRFLKLFSDKYKLSIF